MGWFNEVTDIWIFGKIISIKNEYLVLALSSCLIIIVLLLLICCCCCSYSRLFREAMTCGLLGQSDEKEKRQKSGHGKRYRSQRKRRRWTEPLSYVSSFFSPSDRGYRGKKRKDEESYPQSFLVEAKNEFQQRHLPNKVWPEFLRVYRYLLHEKKVERDTATQAIYSVFYDQQQQQPYVQMAGQPPVVQRPEQEQTQEQQYQYDPVAMEQFKAKNQYLLTDIENMLKAYAGGK